jgi:16S rRNA (guanine527-N7)-methyltransferase
MRTISSDRIYKEIEKYGLNASQELCSKINRYIEMLLRWNATISLTTVTDPVEIVRFHFGESIFALTSGCVAEGRLADVGSGGGFPGIPLHLANQAIHIQLIESNARKCVFLKEVARNLDAEKNIVIRQGRIEDLPPYSGTSKLDYVTARAVGQFESIVAFSKENLKEGGRMVLWVGEDDAAAIMSSDYARELQWGPPIPIPFSEKRYLIWGVNR